MPRLFSTDGPLIVKSVAVGTLLGWDALVAKSGLSAYYALDSPLNAPMWYSNEMHEQPVIGFQRCPAFLHNVVLLSSYQDAGAPNIVSVRTPGVLVKGWSGPWNFWLGGLDLRQTPSCHWCHHHTRAQAGFPQIHQLQSSPQRSKELLLRCRGPSNQMDWSPRTKYNTLLSTFPLRAALALTTALVGLLLSQSAQPPRLGAFEEFINFAVDSYFTIQHKFPLCDNQQADRRSRVNYK
eukprot:6400341-Amphidinium_carterae.1